MANIKKGRQAVKSKLTPMPPISAFFHVKDGRIVNEASTDFLESLRVQDGWRVAGARRSIRISNPSDPQRKDIEKRELVPGPGKPIPKQHSVPKVRIPMLDVKDVPAPKIKKEVKEEVEVETKVVTRARASSRASSSPPLVRKSSRPMAIVQRRGHVSPQPGPRRPPRLTRNKGVSHEMDANGDANGEEISCSYSFRTRKATNVYEEVDIVSSDSDASDEVELED